MKRIIFLGTLTAMALTGAAGAMAHPRGGDRMGPEARFEQMDTNGDGKVTQDEIRARAADRFAKADADGDGFLSADEMVAGMKAREEERAKAREAAKAERMDKMASRMIARLDADDDGKVSAAELEAGPDRTTRMFERLDKDKDGAISAEEMADAGKKGERRMKRDDHRGGEHRHEHKRQHQHGDNEG
ncbi:calcium-binding protein [Pseudooceanicola aestuarii]|uniref:calcium-binding protein n=1 Tax=Pseudooceanicola aestuarii TaxID=2697319 RepID=UPI001EF89220|nr:calcium-binding protein [Pseudooceanicola aestuarii]